MSAPSSQPLDALATAAAGFSAGEPRVISAASQEARSRPHCIFFQRGYCRSGPACEYQHSSAARLTSLPADTPRNPGKAQRRRLRRAANQRRLASREDCGICFENPAKTQGRYGILTGCDHAFCVDCLRKWRRSSTAPGAAESVDSQSMRKACPLCRAPSDHVVPSFIFVVGEQKDRLLAGYRKNCAEIDCKLYAAGRCPFSYRCFYKHTRLDGTVVDKKALAEAAGKAGVVGLPSEHQRNVLDRAQGRRHLRDRHAQAAFSAELIGDLSRRIAMLDFTGIDIINNGGGRPSAEVIEQSARLIDGGDYEAGLDVLLAQFDASRPFFPND
jgi:hypothetical protein